MRSRIPDLPHLIRSAAPTAELVPDRALLAEFVTAKCGMAFELLVRRHGPAVWAVCRRHLANEHDAEDAFQATFLVLAKSAHRIAGRSGVGGWLYGVAYRVALRARRTAARRKRAEAVVSPTDEPAVLHASPFADTAAVIHAELEALPDRYRLPLLLCDLEGLSRKDAAVQLGWTEGTLSGRLSRARSLLAGRLSGRGVAAAVLVAAATGSPSQATTAAAVGFGLSAFGTSSTVAPEAVAALAHGVRRDMTRSFVLKTAGVVLAASVLLGGGLFGLRFDTAPQATAAPVPKVEMAKADDITDALIELVSQPAVQRELKLSSDARVALIDGFEKLDADAEAVKPNWGGQTDGPFIPQLAQPGGGLPVLPYIEQPGWKEAAAARRELVAGTITKGQFTRLRQCEVQVLNTRSLLLKRVQDELSLTGEQKKAMAKAMTKANDLPVNDLLPQGAQQQQQQQLPLPNFAPPLAPVSGASREQSKALDEVVKNFTAGQEKKWKELNGERVGFNVRRVGDQCGAVFSQLRPAEDREHDGQPVPWTVPPPGQPPLLPSPAIGR